LDAQQLTDGGKDDIVFEEACNQDGVWVERGAERAKKITDEFSHKVQREVRCGRLHKKYI